MSLAEMEEASQHSPKRKRPESPNGEQYYGTNGAALQFAYDDEMPSELQSPVANGEEDETPAKKQKVERPRRLNYVPHMTLRGHKRGVTAVRFSPDAKYLASCCMCSSQDRTSKD